VTEIEKRNLETLKRDINDRLLELNGLSHAMELLFSSCDPEIMKTNRFDSTLLFAIQKRLYNDLHDQFQELVA
jgi:hypothetical protein